MAQDGLLIHLHKENFRVGSCVRNSSKLLNLITSFDVSVSMSIPYYNYSRLAFAMKLVSWLKCEHISS